MWQMKDKVQVPSVNVAHGKTASSWLPMVAEKIVTHSEYILFGGFHWYWTPLAPAEVINVETEVSFVFIPECRR